MLLLVLLVLPACPRRATVFPNGTGGYTLVTTAGSLEQALIRMNRSGYHECGGPDYTLSEPQIIHEGLVASALGPTSQVTVQATLTCGPAPAPPP